MWEELDDSAGMQIVSRTQDLHVRGAYRADSVHDAGELYVFASATFVPFCALVLTPTRTAHYFSQYELLAGGGRGTSLGNVVM